MNSQVSVVTKRDAGWLHNLPLVLRGAGAAAVLFALYSFLIRGWSGTGDVVRYLVLLGHTGLLAAIALASARWLRESKGPRVLLGLALVSVTANAAVLGAFLYAAVVSAGGADYPEFLLWTGPDRLQALALTAAALLVLVPVTALGFRTLTRAIARPMAGLFLVSNALLLIPVRDAGVSALLAVAAGAVLVVGLTRLYRRRLEGATREGVTALLLQFLPLVVLMGRTVWLYASDATVALAAALLAFGVLRQLGGCLRAGSIWRLILDVASLWAAAIAACSLHGVLTPLGLAPPAVVLAAGLLVSALAFDLSCRAGAFRSGFRIIASLGAAVTAPATLWVGGTDAAPLLLVVGVGLSLLSYHYRVKAMFAAGLWVSGAGVVALVAALLQWFDFGNWLALAAIGMAAIVAASVLEARGDHLRTRLPDYYRQYHAWDH